MEFLLNKESLQNLSEADQIKAKEAAFGQFLLGSIFGGQGIKSGYEAVQNIAPSIQQQRQQQGLMQQLGIIQEKYLPTELQLGDRAQKAFQPMGPEDYAFSPQAAGKAEFAKQPAPDLNAAFTDISRLAFNPAATKMLPGIVDAFKNLQPTVQGDLVLNANKEVMRGLPTQKDGITSQYNPLIGGFSAAPVQNFLSSKIQTTMPEVSTNTMLVPLAGGGFVQRTIPGAPGAVTEIKSAEAIGQAAGQVEQVVGKDGKTYFVSRASLLNKPPSVGGTTGGTSGTNVGGAVAKISPAQEAINLATSNRYNEFTKTALDAALTVGDRKTSAEYLYNAADQLDPNKTTEWFASGAAYLRAIPGVGDKFDSFVGNVNLTNKTRSEGVLKGLSNIKGNANAFEGGIVDKATTGVTDPKFVTKYVSALEIAAADKDDARQKFIDSYSGDPKNVYTAWANSPDNPRIYNHPKINQFLNEQVRANPSAPVLPAGFGLVQDGKTKQYGIKKPDGSVMLLGQ
jgi:hypothetical protein